MKKLLILSSVIILLGAGCFLKPTDYKEVSIAEINAEPLVYAGEKVELTGILNVRRAICTEMACMFENDECEAGERIECNSCSGEMLLQEEGGEMIKLDGIQCGMQEYVECNVGLVYEVEECDLDLQEGEEYTLSGKILYSYDSVPVLTKIKK